MLAFFYNKLVFFYIVLYTKRMEKSLQYIVHKEEFDTPEYGVGYHLWNKKDAWEHYHNYYEFFIVLDNPIVHRCNGNEKVLSQNTLRFIRPQDIHGFIQYKNLPSLHMNFAATPATIEYLIDFLAFDILRPIIYSDREIEIILTENELNTFFFFFLQINMCEASNHQAKAAITKTLIINALCLIVARLTNQIRNIPEWFSALLDKINTEEMLTCTIDEIYKLSNYSHVMLLQYFKKYTGLTIVQYFTKVKINYACNLLEKTNYTTLDIAGRIGFDSLSHFNRVFKKLTGKSPTEYKKAVSVEYRQIVPPPKNDVPTKENIAHTSGDVFLCFLSFLLPLRRPRRIFYGIVFRLISHDPLFDCIDNKKQNNHAYENGDPCGDPPTAKRNNTAAAEITHKCDHHGPRERDHRNKIAEPHRGDPGYQANDVVGKKGKQHGNDKNEFSLFVQHSGKFVRLFFADDPNGQFSPEDFPHNKRNGRTDERACRHK